MGKRLVIIASGETERRALPRLLSKLTDADIALHEVRIPPRNGALNTTIAVKLINAIWFSNLDEPVDKIVILLDVDGKNPDDVLVPFRDIQSRLSPQVQAIVLLAYAQWHLEAWYFADAANLRLWLNRDLGSIDPTRPDEIQNPKLHLKHLMAPELYTAINSELIAQALDVRMICEKSPSFRDFWGKTMNGADSEFDA